MPWRLIQFIAIFVVLLLFVGFNLTNKCNINFWFKKGIEAPVLITVFGSFILGMLSTLPFIYGARFRKKKPEKKAGTNADKTGLLDEAESVSGKSTVNDDYSDKKNYGID